MSSTTPMPAAGTVAATVKSWLTLARIPFLSVGVLPYLLGTGIALSSGGRWSAPTFWLGLAGVVLIMLTTYFNGEFADVAEDTLSTARGRNPFAGGSGGVVDGKVSARNARVGGNVTAALTVVVGLYLALVARTGVWTLPLGIFGLLAGYFYSARPFRWVERGIGELLIGICYGWLPVAVGYYLQAHELPALLLWVSIPVAFTIFNVIYMNEYPDYESDVAVGKRNLLARIGPARGVGIYVAAVALATASFAYALTLADRPLWPAFAVVTAISLVPTALMLAGRWRERSMLVPLCGLTIVANLATTGVLIAAFWPGA